MHGHQHLAQAHANWCVSRFELNIPEFQGDPQPEEFVVTEKIKKFPQKKKSS
jgi:hypothetical protein